MKTLKSLKAKENFLNWYLGYSLEGMPDCYFLSVSETEALIKKRFAEVTNVEDKLEAYYDTYDFRKECKLLDHDFVVHGGSDYDWMLVEYKGEKYVINDRWNTVTCYENTLIR